MRRVLTLALLAAAVFGAAGTASAKPFVMSPDQADRITAGNITLSGFAIAGLQTPNRPFSSLLAAGAPTAHPEAIRQGLDRAASVVGSWGHVGFSARP